MGTPPEHRDFRFMPDMVHRDSGCLCPTNPYIFHVKCPVHKHLVSVVEAEPKSLVEEIWKMIRYWNRQTPGTAYEERLQMALAEVMEWMEEGHGYLLDGDKCFHSSKTEVEIMHNVLAILQGEKTREIPKP